MRIDGLEALRDSLAGLDVPWAWVGQRSIDMWTVNGFAPVSAVFCCDYGADFHARWGSRPLFSAERSLGYRHNWGNDHLECLWDGPEQDEIDRYLGGLGQPLLTVCYRSLSVLESDSRHRVLAPPLRLKDRFDDKLLQMEIFEDLGLPAIEGHAADLGDLDYPGLRRRLGDTVVIQSPFGSSGETTRLIRDAGDLARLRVEFPNWTRVKATVHAPLPSINGHAAVLEVGGRLRCLAVCPSLQIIGAEGCSCRPEVYCGNDFSAAEGLSELARSRACERMERVGRVLGEAGFRGLFGMDFLVDGDEVLALEINPRFQGSSQMLSLLQAERGEIPVIGLHVLQFLGWLDRVPRSTIDRLADEYRRPYRGAHLIVHSREPGPRLFTHDLESGIHVVEDGALRRRGDGETCCALARDDEWCLLGNLPLPDLPVHHGARLAMAQARRSLLAHDRIELGDFAREFVRAVNERFESRPLMQE